MLWDSLHSPLLASLPWAARRPGCRHTTTATWQFATFARTKKPVRRELPVYQDLLFRSTRPPYTIWLLFCCLDVIAQNKRILVTEGMILDQPLVLLQASKKTLHFRYVRFSFFLAPSFNQTMAFPTPPRVREKLRTHSCILQYSHCPAEGAAVRAGSKHPKLCRTISRDDCLSGRVQVCD